MKIDYLKRPLCRGCITPIRPDYSNCPRCGRGYSTEAVAEAKRRRDEAASQTVVECDCPCHYTPGMLHFMACCQGQCEACGKHFLSGLAKHFWECGDVATTLQTQAEIAEADATAEAYDRLTPAERALIPQTDLF